MEKTLSPYFLVESGDPSPQAFPLKSTNADVKVNGVIADVLVTQTYINDGIVPIHAKYVFPASTRASVHGMKIKLSDVQVVAKIKASALSCVFRHNAPVFCCTQTRLISPLPSIKI